MERKHILFIFVPLLLIGGLILFFALSDEGDKNQPKESNEETYAGGVNFDDKQRLIETELGTDTFTEKNRLPLLEPTVPELQTANAELKGVKDKYQLELVVYESNKTVNEQEEKNFLAVIRNKGNDTFKKEINTPCENYVSVHEQSNFLTAKKDCQPAQQETMELKAGQMMYLPIGKAFLEEGKNKPIFFETPFGIFESAIEIK